MKVGDLVMVKKYGSRHTPEGTLGVIIEELPLASPSVRFHKAFKVEFQDGYMSRFASFCLEVVSESR